MIHLYSTLSLLKTFLMSKKFCQWRFCEAGRRNMWGIVWVNSRGGGMEAALELRSSFGSFSTFALVSLSLSSQSNNKHTSIHREPQKIPPELSTCLSRLFHVIMFFHFRKLWKFTKNAFSWSEKGFFPFSSIRPFTPTAIVPFLRKLLPTHTHCTPVHTNTQKQKHSRAHKHTQAQWTSAVCLILSVWVPSASFCSLLHSAVLSFSTTALTLSHYYPIHPLPPIPLPLSLPLSSPSPRLLSLSIFPSFYFSILFPLFYNLSALFFPQLLLFFLYNISRSHVFGDFSPTVLFSPPFSSICPSSFFLSFSLHPH